LTFEKFYDLENGFIGAGNCCDDYVFAMNVRRGIIKLEG